MHKDTQIEMYSLLAEMYAQVAMIEAMKAENQVRINNGESIAYYEQSFAGIHDKLIFISKSLHRIVSESKVL